jgi:hypothetical protein
MGCGEYQHNSLTLYMRSLLHVTVFVYCYLVIYNNTGERRMNDVRNHE